MTPEKSLQPCTINKVAPSLNISTTLSRMIQCSAAKLVHTHLMFRATPSLFLSLKFGPAKTAATNAVLMTLCTTEVWLT